MQQQTQRAQTQIPGLNLETCGSVVISPQSHYPKTPSNSKISLVFGGGLLALVSGFLGFQIAAMRAQSAVDTATLKALRAEQSLTTNQAQKTAFCTAAIDFCKPTNKAPFGFEGK